MVLAESTVRVVVVWVSIIHFGVMVEASLGPPQAAGK